MMASPLPQELQEIIDGLAVASVDGTPGTYFAAHTRGRHCAVLLGAL